MERLNPSSRSDRYGNRINRAQSPFRVHGVPYVSVLIASLLPFLLLADVLPMVPPLGFLMLIGWRIMRPGVFPLWVGVPLGAFDDLFSGQPFGSAIFLWSIAMIALDAIEARFPWRGFWQDWISAGLAVVVYILAAMAVSGAPLTVPLAIAAAPQIALSILLYPILAQIIAALDRFRLTRTRRIG